ncbi:MAG: class I SAM-dependent methyltransferase [Faecalibacterium sp.]
MGAALLQLAPNAMVLDCGCGGGANIKTLLKLCPNGKVQGIDYSAVSVEKTRRSMQVPLRQDGVPCNRQVWQSCRLKRSSLMW